MSQQELLLEDGSLDWTRTSDIRINSPPFYRLNYEGMGEQYYAWVAGGSSRK